MRIFLSFLFIFTIMYIFGQKPKGYDEELNKMYKNTVELITSTKLAENIENDSNLFLLDTREINEYQVSHLKRARFVGYNGFILNSVADIPKDAEIVVYCSLGVRSERIGEQLMEAGYTHVKNLYGGIFEWVYQDLPIFDKKNIETKEVHAYDENWSIWLLKGEKIY